MLDCPYSQRINDFKDWLYWSRYQALIVEYQDENGEIKRKLVPKRIRFSKHYQKRLRRELMALIPHIVQNYKVMFFLTLTVNPTWNLFEVFGKVSKQFAKVINVLKKRLKRKGISMDYIKVYEPTSKGIIHVHVVLFLTDYPRLHPSQKDRIWLIDKRELDEIWGLGHTWLGWEDKYGKWIWASLEKDGVRNTKKALFYIFKYISKAHSNLLFASLLWGQGRGGGIRSWTVSRGLSELMKVDRHEIPKTGVVVWFGYVWDIPDDLFPCEFDGCVVSSVKEAEELLKRWWDDDGG